MDETSFDIDQAQLREAAERFPAHRLTHAGGRPNSDVTYIATAAEFGRHAWDEGGHL
jgi:hypothetical protein